MSSLRSWPADAQALRELCSANPRPLPVPRKLTRSLRALLSSGQTYPFSWRQLIEQPGDLPDPDSEHCTGMRWTIIPVRVWRAVLPPVRAAAWHLHRLLDFAAFDSADFVESPLPPFVYLDVPLKLAVAGFITLSVADAAESRRWLAESFLIDALPEFLACYEEDLLWSIEYRRQARVGGRFDEGGRP